MFIEQPSPLLRSLMPHAVWRQRAAQERCVYLTFDDGPIPEATPFILDVLRERGIRATFFMVADNACRYPHLLQRVRAEGHAVGNHTYNHYSGLRHTTADYVANVRRANEVLHSRLFRPPHGLLTWQQYQCLQKDYSIVMWDVVTRDYSRRRTAEDVFRNVVRYTREGSIITFHDSLRSIDRLRLVLPRSLDWLAAQGYSFALLTDV